MQKRLFDSEIVTIRQDKYDRVQDILKHIEKQGPSSTRQLARGLNMYYSRVRECVDSLTKLERPILKRMDAMADKAGKPEVPYQIVEPRWREIIRPKRVNKLLEKSKSKIKKLQSDLVNEIEKSRDLRSLVEQTKSREKKVRRRTQVLYTCEMLAETLQGKKGKAISKILSAPNNKVFLRLRKDEIRIIFHKCRRMFRWGLRELVNESEKTSRVAKWYRKIANCDFDKAWNNPNELAEIIIIIGESASSHFNIIDREFFDNYMEHFGREHPRKKKKRL